MKIMKIVTIMFLVMIGCNVYAEESNMKSEKSVVVYFSCSGTTATVARNLGDAIGCKVLEIIPKEKYSSADLDYMDKKSRSSIENFDEKSRPEIIFESDIKGFDTIYLGYPIWWGKAPKPVYTFVESADLTGKKIIPFCTSGGSGIGNSIELLKDISKEAKWMKGRKFSRFTTKEELKTWIDSMK